MAGTQTASLSSGPKARAPASRWRRAAGFIAFALPPAWFGRQAIAAIVAKVGHAGAPLDDAYIHFQYAKAIAEGHPFRFQAGAPFTMGATSLLWPLLLAPFHLVGFRGEAILWPAWALSFASLALLAREVFLLARRLTGDACAAGASLMVLSMGAFTWFAASGMEVVPFALCLARAARRTSEWVEGEDGAPARSSRRAIELVALAWVAPLLRPEGAIASLLVAAALLASGSPGRRAGLALAALAGAVFPEALSLALTGSLASNTAKVKLLFGNPYYAGPLLRAEVTKNLRVLFGTLLDGDVWSAEFLPPGGGFVACAGLLAIPVRGLQARSVWRAGAVVVVALGMCAPCFYVTFLWNRLRYLWPFAPMWLVGIACLARLVGDAFGAVRARWRVAGPVLSGVVAGSLLPTQAGARDDLAASASAIDRQQVTLGRWAKDNLLEDARVGVNDTGAIAYFGDRRTFDIVGLTSQGEGRYWVAGAASRFEHYERLHARDATALPTHFIVYRDWMGCDALLGAALEEATVLDGTILGGKTMGVFAADYTALGTGERPWTAGLDVYDALDVADLESEAEHGYDLLGARDGEQIVETDTVPGFEDAKVTDGGRTNRVRERFTVDVQAGEPSLGVVRLRSTGATSIRVLSDGGEIAVLSPDLEEWDELEFPLSKAGPQTLELEAEGGGMTVFHYWLAHARRP